MKQHQNPKPRPRGRIPNQQRKGNGGPRGNQTFDSNGPSVRIRGTAHQVMEKYLSLARDAAGQGDRVLAENSLQHAEHYFRIIQNSQPRQPRILSPAAADGADGSFAPEPMGEMPETSSEEGEEPGEAADGQGKPQREPAEAELEVVRPAPQPEPESEESPRDDETAQRSLAI